jgi:hypothetical protein
LIDAFEAAFSGCGAPGGGPHDVGLDDEVVGAPDEQQVLDVVAPEEDQLALAVEVVDVDDAESGLAGAAAILRSHADARRGEPAQAERQERQQAEDDRKSDDVLHRRRGVDPES